MTQKSLLTFLATQGQTDGAVNEREYNFLVGKGITKKHLNEMWFQYLRNQGYTGSLSDMFLKWLENPVSITLSGLDTSPPTDSATEGDTIGFTDSRGTPSSQRWQTSATENGSYSDIAGATGSTEVIDIAGATHTSENWIRVGSTVDGVEEFSDAAQIVYETPVGSGAVPEQLWTIGQAITTLSMSSYFVGDDLTYSVTGGALPTGVSLNTSTGDITGTPTADDGTYPVTITATNSGGSAVRGVAISVSSVANIDLLEASDQDAVGDVDLTFTLDVNTGVDVVITTSATTPTAAQVAAGNDHTGSVASHAFSDTWTTGGTATISSLPTLTTGTYYVHALPAGGGDSDVESSNGFRINPFVGGDVFDGRTAADTNPDTLNGGTAATSYPDDILDGGSAAA